MGLINLEAVNEITFETWEHEFLNSLPEEIEIEAANKFGGGIYRMYDAANQIIYVGKSNNLHRRFLQHIGKRTNTAYFMDEVKKIEFHVNNDPVLQTLLESIFIALNEPKYNDEIKDRRKLK